MFYFLATLVVASWFGAGYVGYRYGAAASAEIKSELENALKHWSADVRGFAAGLLAKL